MQMFLNQRQDHNAHSALTTEHAKRDMIYPFLEKIANRWAGIRRELIPRCLFPLSSVPLDSLLKIYHSDRRSLLVAIAKGETDIFASTIEILPFRRRNLRYSLPSFLSPTRPSPSTVQRKMAAHAQMTRRHDVAILGTKRAWLAKHGVLSFQIFRCVP